MVIDEILKEYFDKFGAVIANLRTIFKVPRITFKLKASRKCFRKVNKK